MDKRYNVLVVEPDSGRRSRLREAAKAIHHFGEIRHALTVDEAHSHFRSEFSIHVVLVSFGFSIESLREFVMKAKSTQTGAHAAYIFIMTSVEQDRESVASGVLAGGDGFLFEPFSVDALLEIVRLADKVRNDRARAREQLGISLLLKEIVDQLDLLAFLRANGYEASITQRNLREMCSVLATLEGDSLQDYFEIAARTFGEALPPARLAAKPLYKGHSARIKKLEEERLNDELRNDLTARGRAGSIVTCK